MSHTLTERAIRFLFANRVRPRDSLIPFDPKTNLKPLLPGVLDMEQKQPVFNPSEAHPFDTITRIRLISRIIEGKGERQCGLHFQYLAQKGCLLAHFPLHDHALLKRLADDWLALDIMPWEQVSESVARHSV